jgi:hypothetical protein
MISLLELRSEFLSNLNDTKNDVTSDYSNYSIDSVFDYYEPPKIQTTENISLDIDDSDTKDNPFNESIANLIFEDICLEVISSEFEKPSVPDCILDSFKELFDE